MRISFQTESDATRGVTAEQNIHGFRRMSAAMLACRNWKLCRRSLRPESKYQVGLLSVSSYRPVSSVLSNVLEHTSLQRLSPGGPPSKIWRSPSRVAQRQAAASLARLDPDGKWNGSPNVA